MNQKVLFIFVFFIAIIVIVVVFLSASAKNDNRCIITIKGYQYDVTTLKKTHSGGDVFKCGTDMTTLFNNEHGTDYERMQQYKIN